MKFIDEAKIYVAGGNGGPGFVGWRREKYVPMGGPDGGDGGCGGAVILRVEPGLNTLIDFSFNPHLQAEAGGGGGPNNLHGKDGTDAIFPVPPGTQVYHGERLVADLATVGARWVAARGGVGGRGNAFFKTSKNQSPDYAQPGQTGEQFEFRLVLKSVADVGLIGLPNAGKSSLISRISRATPQVADYPFTTLTPHLGVVVVDERRRFVVADIPGLIPGAHQGKGLGIKFLKHIERTRVLAHLVDVYLTLPSNREESSLSDEEIRRAAIDQFEAIDVELRSFSSELTTLPRLVVFSKADQPLASTAHALTHNYFENLGLPSVLVSSQSGLGVRELLEALASMVAGQFSAK